MRRILILTDQKGWHYKQLIKSFNKYDIDIVTANLSDLSISIVNNQVQILQSNNEILNITDVFVRHIPGGTLEEVITYLNILKVLQAKNINIMNTAENIEMTVDKSFTSLKLKSAGILTPNTWIIRGKSKCKETVNRLLRKHPLIYKPLFGSQGDNIIKIKQPSDFDTIINLSNIYYIQEFLETKPSHDYRVLLIRNNSDDIANIYFSKEPGEYDVLHQLGLRSIQYDNWASPTPSRQKNMQLFKMTKHVIQSTNDVQSDADNTIVGRSTLNYSVVFFSPNY